MIWFISPAPRKRTHNSFGLLMRRASKFVDAQIACGKESDTKESCWNCTFLFVFFFLSDIPNMFQKPFPGRQESHFIPFAHYLFYSLFSFSSTSPFLKTLFRPRTRIIIKIWSTQDSVVSYFFIYIWKADFYKNSKKAKLIITIGSWVAWSGKRLATYVVRLANRITWFSEIREKIEGERHRMFGITSIFSASDFIFSLP